MLIKILEQIKKYAKHWLPVYLFAFALSLVSHELNNHAVYDIAASLKSTPLLVICAAIVLTAFNYFILAAYDWLALYYRGHTHIPLPKIIAAATIGYAISNNTGQAWAAGGSVRYRFYSKWGVTAWDMLIISLFETVTYLLGAMSLGLLGSLVLPHFLSRAHHDLSIIHTLSFACISFLGVYWGAVGFWRKPLSIKGIKVHLPSPMLALWQTIIACIDIFASALVLWVLLPAQVNLELETFLVVFVVAQILGVVSQVPGGLGIFESAFLWIMDDISPSEQQVTLIGTLLLYRAIYFLLPLLVAGAGLLSYEVYDHKAVLIASLRTLKQICAVVVPKPLLPVLFFLGILLFNSEAISASLAPIYWHGLTPLSMMVIIILLGSLISFAYLHYFRGQQLLTVGATFIPAMPVKVRSMPAALARQLTRQDASLRMMLLMVVVWMIYFMQQDEYFGQLFWQHLSNLTVFVGHRSALLLSLGLLVALFFMRRFAVIAPLSLSKPSAQELIAVAEIVRQSQDSFAILSLSGDKYLCWNEDRSAFIMYEATASYWIALGDPIGPREAIASLIWIFREKAHQQGAKAVFYQVSNTFLHHYLELGLSFYKLGEDSKVNLKTFNMKGNSRKNERNIYNRFTKEGYRFEIVRGDQIEVLLPQLRAVSDCWLANKNTREKGFSLGFFDADYLRRTDIAIVRDQNNVITAFANILGTANQQEISMDLMRYNPDCPNIMDFLFLELIFWGQAHNYHWFSTGIAPFSGLQQHPLASRWHKIGTAIFNQGEAFYNFKGVYHYKSKFDPVWEPRYLATYSKLSVPLILILVTRLVSGSWKGIFSR